MALNTFEHQGIFQTARQLPFTIRFSLLEMLMQSLREDLSSQPDAQIKLDMSAPVPIESCSLKQKLRGHEVRGMAKANGHLQSKAEFREEYTDYLIQKYS